MSSLAKLIFIALTCLSGASVAWAGKTQNVLFVIADGVRWQEVFTGADPTLLTDAGGNWTAADELKHKYWSEDPAVRRKLLFPFLWDTVAKQGQLFGNQCSPESRRLCPNCSGIRRAIRRTSGMNRSDAVYVQRFAHNH